MGTSQVYVFPFVLYYPSTPKVANMDATPGNLHMQKQGLSTEGGAVSRQIVHHGGMEAIRRHPMVG